MRLAMRSSRARSKLRPCSRACPRNRSWPISFELLFQPSVFRAIASRRRLASSVSGSASLRSRKSVQSLTTASAHRHTPRLPRRDAQGRFSRRRRVLGTAWSARALLGDAAPAREADSDKADERLADIDIASADGSAGLALVWSPCSATLQRLACRVRAGRPRCRRRARYRRATRATALDEFSVTAAREWIAHRGAKRWPARLLTPRSGLGQDRRRLMVEQADRRSSTSGGDSSEYATRRTTGEPRAARGRAPIRPHSQASSHARPAAPVEPASSDQALEPRRCERQPLRDVGEDVDERPGGRYCIETLGVGYVTQRRHWSEIATYKVPSGCHVRRTAYTRGAFDLRGYKCRTAPPRRAVRLSGLRA